jgi:flagellar protein FliL
MSVVDIPAQGQAPAGEAPQTEQKGSRKKLLLVVVLVLAIAAGGYWWFMLRPAAAEKEPEPGEVLQLEAIQVNLTEGHYLRIGIALQATTDVKEELDGSKALDATIELFSGRTVEDLADRPYRTRLKEKLVHELEEEYHGEVMGVYFTDFVTQ